MLSKDCVIEGFWEGVLKYANKSALNIHKAFEKAF